MLQRARKLLFSLLRIGAGVGISVWLVGKTLREPAPGVKLSLAEALSRLRDNLGDAVMPLLVLAVAAYFLSQFITAYRWRLLLAVQGVHIPYWEAMRLNLIGLFFNLAIPGAVSGDLVKMAYISRHMPEKSAESILCTVVDRILGMLGLFVLASLMVLANLPFLLALGPESRTVKLAAFVVGLGSLGGILAMAAVELRETFLRIGPIRRLTDWVAARLPKGLAVLAARATAAVELFRRNRATVLWALLLSLVVHVLLATCLFLIGRGVHETVMSARGYFLAAPVANAISAIPLTPSGFGLRDFGLNLFFQAMHATPGKNTIIPVIQTLIIVLIGLTGGLVFAFSRAPARKPSPSPG